MTELADMLQVYGITGMAVAEMAAIVWMARYIVRLHSERRTDDKQMVAAMVEVKESLKAIHEELKGWRQ